MSREEGATVSKISRGEAETLCILNAVGADGCATLDLAPRLGLSRTLSEAVAAGMDSLIAAGLLECDGDRFTRTTLGTEVLRRRLTELGLA